MKQGHGERQSDRSPTSDRHEGFEKHKSRDAKARGAQRAAKAQLTRAIEATRRQGSCRSPWETPEAARPTAAFHC